MPSDLADHEIMPALLQPRPPRIRIVIVDRVQQWRFPRSKKKRIRRKWRKREENWRPMMVPVGIAMFIGAEAAAAVGGSAHSGPVENHYEMSTDLWCMAAGLNPEFAERCDLFMKVRRMRAGVPWHEDVPMAECLETDEAVTR